MISELNIIKNFEIITERFGLGNPVEDTFPNGESNKLASWLIEMKDKKHLSKKMGELGRKYVEENASERIICSKYLNIFEKYLSPNTK